MVGCGELPVVAVLVVLPVLAPAVGPPTVELVSAPAPPKPVDPTEPEDPPLPPPVVAAVACPVVTDPVTPAVEPSEPYADPEVEDMMPTSIGVVLGVPAPSPHPVLSAKVANAVAVTRGRPSGTEPGVVVLGSP